MSSIEGWKIIWGALFLTMQFVLIYGAIQHILVRRVENSRDAKRFNESVKFATSAMNSLAVGMIAGAVIVPAINQEAIQFWSSGWAIAGLGLIRLAI